jgi:hypothetical protein
VCICSESGGHSGYTDMKLETEVFLVLFYMTHIYIYRYYLSGWKLSYQRSFHSPLHNTSPVVHGSLHTNRMQKISQYFRHMDPGICSFQIIMKLCVGLSALHFVELFLFLFSLYFTSHIKIYMNTYVYMSSLSTDVELQLNYFLPLTCFNSQ